MNTAPNENIIIETKQLVKQYAHGTVINNLTFKINMGDKVFFWAPSGSGKTTLFNILLGLIKPDSGEFTAPKIAGVVFQKETLFPFKNIKENLLYPCKVNNIKLEGKTLEMYEQWIELCNLQQFLNHYPNELSGGMKQKVAIARAFIFSPDVIFLDEAFHSLDGLTAHKIKKFIDKEYKHKTILAVTHSPVDIEELGAKVFKFKGNYLNSPEIINVTNKTVHEIVTLLMDVNSVTF